MGNCAFAKRLIFKLWKGAKLSLKVLFLFWNQKKKKTINYITIKYADDLNGYLSFALKTETKCFEHYSSAAIVNQQLIHKQYLQDIYLNIEIALVMISTIPKKNC